MLYLKKHLSILYLLRKFENLSNSLLPSQKNFIEGLALKVTKMNVYQVQTLEKQFSDKVARYQEVAPLTYYSSWPSKEDFSQFSWFS